MYELKSNGKLIIAVLKCYVIVELGVIQQYIINLKTAIFILRKMKFSRKSSGITYLGLAVALATWYNKKRKLQGRDREIIDMENYMQTTGIKQTVIQEIQELAVKHGVSRVILFGSRARGTFREKSDIDLAVEGGDFIRFSLDVDENTSTLLKYDFINLDEPIQEELRASIQKEGKLLYEKI